MTVTKNWVLALLVAIAPITWAQACPTNSIGTTTKSKVYGYATDGGCAFRTLEEAESYGRLTNGAISIAFPLSGVLEQPIQGGVSLDYRPFGAFADGNSGILIGPPSTVQSSYAISEAGWPPTSVPSSCANLTC